MPCGAGKMERARSPGGERSGLLETSEAHNSSDPLGPRDTCWGKRERIIYEHWRPDLLTHYFFLSGGVITDLTILWIYIQSNKHSWGDGRKYRFQAAKVTSLLLHMSWSRKEEMLNFLRC